MKKQSFIYIILAGMLWGTSGIFVNFLAPYGFSSLHLSAVRGTVSFICIALFALVRDRSLFKVKAKELLLLAAVGAMLFATASLYYTAMQKTSIATAVVLMYTAPIYVMITSVLFLGEKMNKLKVIAICTVIVGCALVSGIVGGAKFNLIGILLGVLSGITYGAYNIITKIAMKKKIPPLKVSLYGFLFMSLIALLFSHPEKIPELAKAEPTVTVPLLIGLGIATFVLPYTLYTIGMKNLSASVATALSIVEPMAATIFGIILFNEPVDIFKIFGIALILLSVYLLSRSEAKDGEANN